MGKITNILKSNLTHKWFITTKDKFEKHQLYNSETNKLHFSGYTDDGEDLPELTIELKEFAWNPFVDEQYHELSGDDPSSYFRADEYFDEIIEYVKQEIKSFPPENQYKYIIELNKSIKNSIARIKEFHHDKDDTVLFQETLDYVCECGI